MGADPSTVQALQQDCERFIKLTVVCLWHTQAGLQFEKCFKHALLGNRNFEMGADHTGCVRQTMCWLSRCHVSNGGLRAPCFPVWSMATFNVVSSVGVVALGWSFSLAAVPKVLTITFAMRDFSFLCKATCVALRAFSGSFLCRCASGPSAATSSGTF